MDNEYSYRYIFHDLLAVIDIYVIQYKFVVKTPEFEEWDKGKGTLSWDLKITRFSNYSIKSGFKEELQQIVNNIIEKINQDIDQLHYLLKYFSEQIKSEIGIIESLDPLNKTRSVHLRKLIKSKKIKFVYLGRQEIYEYIELFKQFGDITVEPDRAYDDYEYLTSNSFKYFETTLQSLQKLYLFLMHLQNVISFKSQEKIITNPSEFKKKLIAHLKKDEITEILDHLNSLESIAINPLFINLSSRHNSLEKKNSTKTISWQDYSEEHSRIVDAFLRLIMELD